MKQIHITRDSSGTVAFEPVSIDATETVFFTNMDPQSAHWPTIASNQLGPAPSPNSSQCNVPPPPAGSTSSVFTYKCKIDGHTAEQGTINVFVPLAAQNTTLKGATVGKPIEPQSLTVGGTKTYVISDQVFQVTDATKKVIQSGPGVGPGLQLNSTDSGVTVSGTPSLAGTYAFTFTVNDGMGRNLQQVQYTMAVAPAS